MKNQLYHPAILQTAEDPYHFAKPEGDPLFIANNPYCGDRFKIYAASIQSAGVVYFHGHGCAVSKASTSIFVELFESMDLPDLKQIANNYVDFVQNREDSCPHEKLEIFRAVQDFPARFECALLPWKAFIKALK